MKHSLFIILIVLMPMLSFSQNWELGFQGGLSQYFGDLSNNKISLISKSPDHFGGIQLRRYFGNNTAVRLNLMMSDMSGDDRNFEETASRGLSFSGHSTELSGQLEYFILGKESVFSPYVFMGLGYVNTHHNVSFAQNFDQSIATSLFEDRAEGRSTNSVVIPLGIGINFHPIEDYLGSIGVEYSFRPTSSDYIDGISNAGDPDDNDWLSTLGLVIGLPIGKGAPDTDNDGIKDKNDSCPNTPGLKLYNGCPDSDGDGIIDSDDNCPNAAGIAEYTGCPDSDKDGIIDINDDCPQVAGLSSTNGCPDTDKDGIRNSEDKCPNIAGKRNLRGCPDSDDDGVADGDDDCPTEKGLKTNKGCPNPDSDNDGIADKDDDCPDVAGSANTGGCPDGDEDGVIDSKDDCPTIAGIIAGCPDSDKDGVADKDDSCPNKGGNIDSKGCPKVDAKTVEVFSRAMSDIRFETSSDVIRPSSISILNEVVDIMRANPSYKVRIAGHTDSVGADGPNQSLSQKRATSVLNYLVGKGIFATRLSAIGYGEAYPIANNNTKEGRRLNRRVELTVKN